MTLIPSLLEKDAGRCILSLPKLPGFDTWKCIFWDTWFPFIHQLEIFLLLHTVQKMHFSGIHAMCKSIWLWLWMHFCNFLYFVQVVPLKCLQNLEAMLKKDRTCPSSRSSTQSTVRWVTIASCHAGLKALFLLQLRKLFSSRVCEIVIPFLRIFGCSSEPFQHAKFAS